MRAANSWIIHPSPSSSSFLSPPQAEKCSTTQPLSDFKPNLLRSNNSTRRLSHGTLLDKENNTQGYNDGLVFLTSPKDTLSVHTSRTTTSHGGFDPLPALSSNKNRRSMAAATTAATTKTKPSWIKEVVVVDSSKESKGLQDYGDDEIDNEDENIFLSPTGPTSMYKSSNTAPTSSGSNSPNEFPYSAPNSTTSASTTSSSIVFRNGKMFWMKFLDQPSSQGTNNDEEENEYNGGNFTPLGRMIQQTFTTGSPLSDASEYNGVGDGEASTNEVSPPPASNTAETTKSTTPSTSELAKVFQARQPGIKVTNETKIPTARSSPVDGNADNTARLEVKREAVPISSSGDKQDQTTFTGSDDAPLEMISPVQAAKLRFEQHSKQAIAKQAIARSGPLQRGASKAKLPSESSLASESVSIGPIKGSKSTSDESTRPSKRIISQVREGQSSLKVSTAFSRTASMSGTKNMTATSLDEMIEIGGPFHTPTSLSSSACIPTTDKTSHISGTKSTKDQKENGQHKALKAWKQAGLQSKESLPCQNAAIKNTSETIRNTGKTTIEWTRNNLKNSMPTPKTAPPKMVRSTSTSTARLGIIPLPKQDEVVADPGVPGASNGGSFRILLQTWRNISDDKPNAHFLSPQNSQQVPARPSTTSKLPSTKATSDISVQAPSSLQEEGQDGIFHKIQTFDKDHFDRVREQPALANRATHKPASAHCVDSDIYEESFVEDEEDEPNRVLVILENNDTFQIAVGDSRHKKGIQADELKIRNVELVTSSQQHETQLIECQQCECSGSIFSGNGDLISFFLPQMGMACTCGKQKPRALLNPDDPTALDNVLRPWQVEFLKSFGIYRGEQLVKARHRSAGILARALRQWRRKNDMAPFKTSSCGMAIDIWAKTCKVYVRSIRKQIDAGHDLLERRSDDVMKELIQFAGDLPDAPRRRKELFASFDIEPESQMEV